MEITTQLAREFNLKPGHVGNIVSLIDDGNTIPFIALQEGDDGLLRRPDARELSDRLAYLRNLEKRKAEVKESIAAQEKLTDELSRSIDGAATLAEVEDLYRPFRPKRRTRATVAREKGLVPLAEILMAQDNREGTPEEFAAPFADSEKGVASWEEALQGAMDILAEDISDDAECRKLLRALMFREGRLVSKAAKEEKSVYEMYYDYAEHVSRIPSHRILAVNRGEKEGFLKVNIELNGDSALDILYRRFVFDGSVTTETVKAAAQDAWKRLIEPSIEREVRNELTDRASEQAIKMFGLNLKPLLMQPPVRNKVILGLDPAYRTGARSPSSTHRQGAGHRGGLSTPPRTKPRKQKGTKRLIEKHGVDVISIGNGTASRNRNLYSGLIAEWNAPSAIWSSARRGRPSTRLRSWGRRNSRL